MRRWADADGVLKEAGEAVRQAFGGASVEAEDVLVEIGLAVLGADGAVVGGEQPALDEAEDEVDHLQPLAGIVPRPARLIGSWT